VGVEDLGEFFAYAAGGPGYDEDLGLMSRVWGFGGGEYTLPV